MPVELSLLAMTVSVLGLKCIYRNILVKSILAVRGHQMTLQSASLPRAWDLGPSPRRETAQHSLATTQKIFVSYLLCLSVLHSIDTVLAPKPTSVAGKFSKLSHF